MKNTILILFILFNFSFFVKAQEKVNPNIEERTYLLNPFQSVLNWNGSYAFQITEYNGTVALKKGRLYTTDGQITGGSFTIDMTTITTPKHTIDNNNGPVEHLKNSDFFDVIKYPEAHLELTKVTYYSTTNEHRLEGDLTIKGVTKSIMIMAMVNDKKRTLETKFKIDRTDWGINYQSKFKDSTISDAIIFDSILQFE